MAEKDKELIENIEKQEYKYGFTSDIETETIPRGLNEEVVRLISTKKGEPEWMTERRLKAYRHWLNMVSPSWAHLTIPPIDFRTSSIMRRRSPPRNSRRWTRSIPNSNARSTSWVFRSRNRWRWRVSPSMP